MTSKTDMKDILDRIADSSPNESSHDLICRLRDCAREIASLRVSTREFDDKQGAALLHAAADECMSPEQRNMFDYIGMHDADVYRRFFRCINKRLSETQEMREFAAHSAGAQEFVSTDAARDVLAERRRQIEVEGWTPEHDDDHSRVPDGDLALAAACYALSASGAQSDDVPKYWPWAPVWWKPTTPRRDLVKAAALILAEIERIDRAEGKS